MPDSFQAIDPQTLPKHFDSAEAERRWDEVWEKSALYHYDESKPRAETFVVDTPPPTVSGSLHVGHVFSYTHTDIVVRYQRMRQKNIFYPMGWDDNGLPTERRVQNYYHVRCEPREPYEAGLERAEASAKVRKERPKLLSRKNFIELCEKLTLIDEQAYMDLFRRLGLSVDWRQTYATIDSRCRKVSQLSFLDLFDKGLVYQNVAPTMWDVDFQTAVAQAEVQDRMRPGAYHHIEFAVEGSEQSFVIATTRPELLPACVGVTAHPSDPRFNGLFGKRAVTPLFGVSVPIFPSELADPEKGTGILMVCTFGDQTDVGWWRSEKLALRQILGRDGRLQPVEFGSDEYPSRNVERARSYYAELAGKNLHQARLKIVEQLRDPEGSATGKGAPLRKEPVQMEHVVKFYEKGDRPLEYLSTRQWFARLMDNKQRLLDKGSQIKWHPEFMHARYRDWTDKLGLDWCLSRQRYFGVPIPVWYPIDAAGEIEWDKPILPAPDALPVDPMSDTPPGYGPEQRGKPGGFDGEPDIFDTWFTSSMTPQIGSGWGLDAERHQRLFPADIRPQSHEIIRTWAFYTIAKALLHEDEVPWHNVLISGWILDPDRKKMSKSQGNVVTPMHLFDEHGVDAVRYWTASARLGADTAFDVSVFKIGRRLVTKIFNASKFVLAYGGDQFPITEELDRSFLHKLSGLVQRATAAFDDFNYAMALEETESFFWGDFTDTYLELAKPRAWSLETASPEERGSAIATLRLALGVLLRLFAPALPYITEEVWSWAFAEETGQPSIHRAPWPHQSELSHVAQPTSEKSFDLAVVCLNAINKAKSDASVSTGRVISDLQLACHPDTKTVLAGVLKSAAEAARATSYQLAADSSVDVGACVVRSATFADSPPKKRPDQ